MDHEVDVDIDSLKKELNIVDGMNYYQIMNLIYLCLSDVYDENVADRASEVLTDMICETLYYYTL